MAETPEGGQQELLHPLFTRPVVGTRQCECMRYVCACAFLSRVGNVVETQTLGPALKRLRV